MALRTFKPRNVAHGALLRNALLDGRVLSLVRSLQLPAASSRGDLAYTQTPRTTHVCGGNRHPAVTASALAYVSLASCC